MLRKVSNALKNFNTIGNEVEFDINGFSRVPSCFGTLVSAVGLLVITTVGIQFILGAFNTKSPDINVELKTLPVYPKIELYKNNFFFVVLPIDMAISGLPLTSFMTMNAYVSKREFVKAPNGTILDAKFKNVYLDTIQCSELQRDPRFNFIYANKNVDGVLNIATCLLPKKGEEEEYFVEGEPLSDFDSNLNIEILPCSLDDPTQCASREQLKFLDFLITYPNPDVDYSKTEDFLTWIAVAGTRARVNVNDHQLHILEVSSIELNKDSSFMGKPTKEAELMKVHTQYSNSVHREVSQLHCPKAILNNPFVCQPYISLRIITSNKREVITRVYPNIFQALSEVGGFRELVFMAAALIYMVYDYIFDAFKRYIVDNVYGYKHSKKEFKEHIGSIEDHLDIIKLIKELNGLKVLNRVIFKDHHIALLPKVLAKLKEEEEEKKKEIAKEKEKSVSTLNRKLGYLVFAVINLIIKITKLNEMIIVASLLRGINLNLY